jgi:hypothetical protein
VSNWRDLTLALALVAALTAFAFRACAFVSSNVERDDANNRARDERMQKIQMVCIDRGRTWVNDTCVGGEP